MAVNDGGFRTTGNVGRYGYRFSPFLALFRRLVKIPFYLS